VRPEDNLLVFVVLKHAQAFYFDGCSVSKLTIYKLQKGVFWELSVHCRSCFASVEPAAVRWVSGRSKDLLKSLSMR
jgi:hypothetical protein